MQINTILQDAVTPKSASPVASDDAAVAGLEAYVEAEALFQAEADINDIEAAMDITSNTIAGLESISDVLVASEENGGLDASGAMLLNASVSSIMAPFGGYTAKPMPSNEAFEEDGGRVAATAYGLEAVKETLQKMWDAVKRFVSDMVKKVKVWLNENIGSMKRLAKAAEAMSKKAMDSDGEPKEKKISVPKAQWMYMSDMSFIGSASDAKSVLTAVEDKAKKMKERLDAINEGIDGLTGLAENLKKGESASKIKGLDGKLAKDLLDKYPYDASSDEGYKEKGMKVFTTDDNLPGGISMAIKYKEDIKSPKLSDITLFWTGNILKADELKDKEEVALDSAGIASTMEMVKTAAEALVKATSDVTKAADSASKLTDKADKAIKVSDDKLEDSEAKIYFRKVIGTTRKHLSVSVSMPNKGLGALRSIVTAQYAFAKASYKNLKVAE